MEVSAGQARAPWGWLALVVTVALAASVAGLGNGFVQDDMVLLAQDSRMHSLANWQTLLSAPYWPPPWTEDLWRPLTSLGLTAQYQVGGGSPLVFRIVSIALYAGTSAAAFLLLVRLLPLGAAVCAALLFAAHPIHVEAVALAVAQAELVVALLAMMMTGWYLRCRRRGDGHVRLRDWFGLAVLYLMAALTKEHGLVLPGLLVAAEWSLLSGPLLPRIRRLWPGFAILGVLGVLVVQVRALVQGGSLVGSFTAEALEGLSLGGRGLTMLAVAPHWLRLLLWPAHLRADYSPQELVASSGFGGLEALGLLLVVLVVAGAVWARRSLPVVSLGLLWVVIGIFPVSNVVVPTGVLLAERTLFLASVGVLVAFGGLLGVAWQAGGSVGTRGRQLAMGATGVLTIVGVARSVERWPSWHDETSYVVAAAADSPRSFRAQRAWGEVLFLEGKRDEGMAAYGRALQYAPPAEAWRVRNDLARRHFEEGASALAVQQLLASREQTPGEQETWNYLILGLLNLGEYPLARQEAETALARGFSVEVFEDLRALADTAMKANVPAGAIRINVVRPQNP